MRLIIDEVAYDLPGAVDAEGRDLVRARASMVVRENEPAARAGTWCRSVTVAEAINPSKQQAISSQNGDR